MNTQLNNIQDEQKLYDYLITYLNNSFGMFSITVEKRMGININQLICNSKNSGQFLDQLAKEGVKAVQNGVISLDELIIENIEEPELDDFGF